MSSFLKFIEEDISAKRALLSTLPTTHKRDIKKFNVKINEIDEKYLSYKEAVKKYLIAKSKSFKVNKEENKELDKVTKELDKIEHIKFILNPMNTYLEKMGFDNLLYQIRYYYDFNLDSINEIIEELLKKFELVNINLNSDDFKYTCYVNEYMFVFLNNRNKDDFSEVNDVFEKIYWVNPDIIQHIELNFRKLIKKHSKTFENYIHKLQKNIMKENDIKDYADCLQKYKSVYKNKQSIEKETLFDIVEKAKENKFDINTFFEDSKVRISTYNNFMIEPIDTDNKEMVEKFYDDLNKLKANVLEYYNYTQFLPLFNNFKEEYEKEIPLTIRAAERKDANKMLKNIEGQIAKKEESLNKVNKQIFSHSSGLFKKLNEADLRLLKIESVKISKELYDLYKEYDQEYFKEKVLLVLNGSLTISDVLNLYYSYDYFKKKDIKKVLNINNYKEILKYSEEFDLFANNPLNIITTGLPLFEESNIKRVIMNKYRLNNINITEAEIDEDNLMNIIDRINLLSRIKIVEESDITVEKIWFIVQVDKLLKKEKKPQ
ncbi:MAG: hypothetical protein PHD02_02030 [Bacilli bacterium]|nr:hypothetical protein [Bacilli bacterium]